jgi:hypothetical protein
MSNLSKKKFVFKCQGCKRAIRTYSRARKCGIKNNYRSQKYFFCSPECSQKYHRKTKNRIRICKLCKKEYSYKRRIKAKDKFFICNKCLRVKYCKRCNMPMWKVRAYRHCNPCIHINKTNRWMFSYRGEKQKKCTFCGIYLNEITKTHSHHEHTTCDVCESIRKRQYKDRAKYGIDDLEILLKLAITEQAGTIGRKEKRSCRKMSKRTQLMIVKKRANLLKSDPLRI